MKILFCAYRSWALNVFNFVKKHPRVSKIRLVSDNELLKQEIELFQPDLILFCGWSWPPTEELVKLGTTMITEHPAACDRYSPGTPIQNQILDGVYQTKHRIVKVGFPELSLRLWSHEIDMDLTGNMDDILLQMEVTSKTLYSRFLNDYPNIIWNSWKELPLEQQAARRTPAQSKIEKEEFQILNTQKLYDKIRCLESPYPNAYLEDETGILYFTKVSFKAKT